jgi:hypothetical protein
LPNGAEKVFDGGEARKYALFAIQVPPHRKMDAIAMRFMRV